MGRSHKHKSDKAKKAWQRESDARYQRIVNEFDRRNQDENHDDDIPEVDPVGKDSDEDDLP